MMVCKSMIPKKYHNVDLEEKAIILGKHAVLDFVDIMLRKHPDMAEKYIPSL